MLIKVKKTINGFVEVPRRVPASRAENDSSVYNGIFLRPNLQSTGQVPSQGTICTSPDIWVAGTTPVAGFCNTLATSESYAMISASDVCLQMDNYFYVRGYNGAAAPQTVNAKLRYAPSGIINNPGLWANNIVKTDQNNPTATIANLAPNSIGVADQTFFWPKVPSPSELNPNSTHYCMFAHVYSGDEQMPSIGGQVDMCNYITNDVTWAWRNFQLIDNGAPASAFSEPLIIPSDWPQGTTDYYIFVCPVGYQGWDIAFESSQADSKGNPISLTRTTIGQQSGMYGVKANLEPGFQSTISIYLYNPRSVTPQAGATAHIICQYDTSGNNDDLKRATELGLIDMSLCKSISRGFNDIGLVAVISLGDCTAMGI